MVSLTGGRYKVTIRILKLPHNVVLIKIMDIDEASKINEIDVPGVYFNYLKQIESSVQCLRQ